MELKLEHIAPYLPYGLKIKYRNGNPERLTGTVTGIEGNLVITGYHIVPMNGTFKPLLRPMSDITKEIEHNGERFVPIDSISKKFDFSIIEHAFLEQNAGSNKFNWIRSISYPVILKLISWHFDVFGLLDKNLATAL